MDWKPQVILVYGAVTMFVTHVLAENGTSGLVRTLRDELSINYLEQRAVRHHPVMRLVPDEIYPIPNGFLIEVNGLQVPDYLDCENIAGRRIFQAGGYRYFNFVPSRWFHCYLHAATLQAGLRVIAPKLPIVDEEYVEWLAVLQSALRAKGSFIMAELGARWGTWGARAVAMLRKRNPMSYKLHFTENDYSSCKELRNVMYANSINYSLICKDTETHHFVSWLNSMHHVDLVDMDIQGAEHPVLLDPAVFSAVRAKVYRLIIATHGKQIHADLANVYGDWMVTHTVPVVGGICKRIIEQFYDRGSRMTDGMQEKAQREVRQDDLKMIIKKGCCVQTHQGMITHFDGELILDNPKFVRADRRFSPSSDHLVVDDLL